MTRDRFAGRFSGRLAQLQAAGRFRAEPGPGLGAIALALTAEDPDRVVISQDGRDITRWDMVAMARRLGGALQARGLTPGAVVAFQLPNWWEATVINMACALFGWRIVPLLPIYRAAELGTILPACGVDAIFVPPASPKVDYRATVEGLAHVPGTIVTVRGEGCEFAGLLESAPATPQLPPSTDAKMIIFTSGSTGRPKGVIHTHASLDAVVRRTGEFWGMGEDDVLYVPSPIAHIGGSIYAFEFPWITGCRTILEDGWDPARAVRQMDAEGVTFMAGATPFLRGLLDAAKAAGTNLPGLRRFICGGASVPPELVRDALEAFPNAIVSRAYGSTEVPLAFPGIRDRAGARAHADTDGERAVSVRLLDPDPTGAGEIAVQGPQMFVGYLDPEDDAGSFTEDGFFMMGDLGRMVDDSFVAITGRTKDIIIRKGENISPLEIENALQQHPGVAAVSIVGAPDPERGEMVVAFVVPAPGAAFDFAQMVAHLEQAGFARQKFPERLELVDALPMNAVGKVQKPELRRIAANTGSTT
ncbi:AMP-binding protein [Chachezhania antarctica]|uniref:AMP-binding protein n=1 Tax=Chachezhania antarctica TaxID=2340860 RepID=UPI000EB3D6B2|nr:AMP-binding protein [Chachezhania antarctica]|tara:strand:- start:341 stop:1933 length:1593 start_codon:yes stop_codon:yes gene_type:complete